MTVEYDLIVIGGSTTATYVAVTAAHWNARVALVEPPESQTNGFSHGTLYTQALTHVGCVAQHMADAPQLGISVGKDDLTQQPAAPFIQWNEAMQWAKAIVYTQSEQNSLPILASLGVDVITGCGEFCRRPHLGFIVNDRRLRGRTYLIATGSRPAIPDIEGLKTISYLTTADFWQLDLSLRLRGSWVVIGGEPMGTQLAQTLARLNCEVTLVVSTPQILSGEDPEASSLVQAQLEAEGIRVLTNSPVTQMRRIDDKKWIQAGDQAIEADEILLATSQQPNVESLNLDGVGVKYNQQRIQLNEKLQTTNPRIYACGDVAGGSQFAHIAQYEASIALKNALFAPLFKVNYQGIPWAIFTDPQLARVGLTEAQARLRYHKDVFVARHYFKTLDKAQLLGKTTGFCKIVGRQNGEILGASIVGPEASELIGTIAFAIQHKIKVGAIADFPQVSSTLSEILQKTAMEWRQQRLSRNQALQNVLEGLFTLRRQWNR
ncbi:MAG TPA: FAD-dependent oxidoreductase [Coleofasciculaceae cyanobacterium]